MAKLELIEGIGPVYANKLRDAGIRSINALLEAGATPKGRKELAEKSGISYDLILAWVNRADLMRVSGVGEEYSDLLEKAGVDTVVELAQRNPAHLYDKLMEVSASGRLVRRPPSRAMVEAWVEEAKKLPRVVTY